MANAGLGDDLLLRNEVVDPTASAASPPSARVTIAVDSRRRSTPPRAGLGEVVIDVYVGMPRCGCPPDRAGRLADAARSRGLAVRGVMGYEGHVVGVRPGQHVEQTEAAMRQLHRAADVGGELVSGGGTGTFDINRGSPRSKPAHARSWTPRTAISTCRSSSRCRSSPPSSPYQKVGPSPTAGSRPLEWTTATRRSSVTACGSALTSTSHSARKPPSRWATACVLPAHVDPTVAYHERMHVATDDNIVDTWEIDLRGW